MHGIETTTSISTKFCITIKTTKYSSSLVIVGGSIVPQINPRWIMADGCHFANIDKSPYLGSGSTDRHEIWHGDAEWPSLVPYHFLTLSTYRPSKFRIEFKKKQVAQLSQRDRATHELLRFAKLRSGIFEPPFWGLRGNVDASCVRRWKKRGRLPIGDN